MRRTVCIFRGSGHGICIPFLAYSSSRPPSRLFGSRNESLELACGGVTRDLGNNNDVDVRIRQPKPAQRGDQCESDRRGIRRSDYEHVGPARSLMDLVFRDHRVGAQYVAKRTRRDHVFAVAEVVVTPTSDVGNAHHRTAAFAASGQQRDLVAEVITNERERAAGKPGRERTRGRLIRSDWPPSGIDPLEDHLVLADVKTIALAAADSLNSDFGRAP